MVNSDWLGTTSLQILPFGWIITFVDYVTSLIPYHTSHLNSVGVRVYLPQFSLIGPMWLRKELQQICIKEFSLRHQLDLIQENAYIQFHLQRLIVLDITEKNSNTKEWQYVANLCNQFWFSIVGYLKLSFLEVYTILDQKDFLDFTPVALRKGNWKSILQNRIQSCKTFLEICRAVVYSGKLRELVARTCVNRELFSLLSENCTYSDPPGSALIRLGNRINFIRNWIEKLVLRRQSTYIIPSWEPVPIPSNTGKRKTPPVASPAQASQGDTGIPVVSATKPTIQFTRFRKRSSRLSDILQDYDSDSNSSTDSLLWSPPFKKTKGNISIGK